ncbi:hypothetical protein Prum_072630 [Phytohabitans rumicis]|uniref:Uncharacterized protein n=1 Tax=Phytohabitans rumicis TaxID=1076125 RepID=A0A6V8LFL2_9ACTN|nr:hypothetical protein Prum_072630 [Phytohabitans rumicis]
MLHGEAHFLISGGLKPVPYKDWKAARARMADLAVRAVGHLPASSRTPAPTRTYEAALRTFDPNPPE